MVVMRIKNKIKTPYGSFYFELNLVKDSISLRNLRKLIHRQNEREV